MQLGALRSRLDARHVLLNTLKEKYNTCRTLRQNATQSLSMIKEQWKKVKRSNIVSWHI